MLAYETVALATEAETKAFSVVSTRRYVSTRSRGETEVFEISTEVRLSRGTTAPWDGLKTESTSLVYRCQLYTLQYTKFFLPVCSCWSNWYQYCYLIIVIDTDVIAAEYSVTSLVVNWACNVHLLISHILAKCVKKVCLVSVVVLGQQLVA